MSLLWRKNCAEPCSKCNESTGTDLTCDFCGKGICAKEHAMTVTEKKEETVENSNKNEKVDCASGMQHSDTQGKDNDLEAHIDCGERSQEISEVKYEGTDLLKKQNTDKKKEMKGHQVCRMCYTVYKRINSVKLVNEKENMKVE